MKGNICRGKIKEPYYQGFQLGRSRYLAGSNSLPVEKSFLKQTLQMSNSPLHFKIIETPAGTNEVEWKHSTRHMITALELRT